MPSAAAMTTHVLTEEPTDLSNLMYSCNVQYASSRNKRGLPRHFVGNFLIGSVFPAYTRSFNYASTPF